MQLKKGCHTREIREHRSLKWCNGEYSDRTNYLLSLDIEESVFAILRCWLSMTLVPSSVCQSQPLTDRASWEFDAQKPSSQAEVQVQDCSLMMNRAFNNLRYIIP